MQTRTIMTGIALLLLASGTGRAQDWQQNDALFNPSGVPSLRFSQPRLADLDADGDLDLILGGIDDAPLYFQNTGSASTPVFQAGPDIFAPVDPLDAEMGVAVDLDGDGDLDLVCGGATGLQLYANVGSVNAPVFAKVAGFFTGLLVGSIPVPALADLDDDGDYDLLVGLSEDGALKYYPNTGTPQIAEFLEGQAQTWFDVGLYAYPWLADLDGDEDLDLLVGRDGPGFYFYRNLGDATSWSWQADHEVFAGLAQATYWNSPCLADLTGDGLPDLLFGTDSGPLQYYVNTGSAADPIWTLDANLFGGVLDVGSASSPFFYDFDGDGDLDLASGSQLGDIRYYENVGSSTACAWRADPALFASIDHSIYSAITLGDVDADGLPDAVVGDLSGNLFFHHNTGGDFSYDAGVFQGIDVGAWSVPRLVDMDGDLDLDLVVGNEAGQVLFFENIGGVHTPVWEQVVGYFGSIDVGSNCVPTLGDLDHDGDQDLVTGSLFHEVRYYEHTEAGWVQDPGVVAGITAGQNAAPALADLDADGDLDLTIGNYTGTFNYYENTSVATPVPDSQGTAAGPCQLAVYPNPFNGTTLIRYELPVAEEVTLAIHDVTGRRVRQLPVAGLAAGPQVIAWDGTDDSGRSLGSGVYFCRVKWGGPARAIKLVYVK